MSFDVQFPGLGLEFTINRVALSIGGFNIYWYGVIIAAGMVLAMLFAFRNADDFGINSDRLIDVILVGAVMAIVCARIYYIVFAPFKYESIWQMIDIRQLESPDEMVFLDDRGRDFLQAVIKLTDTRIGVGVVIRQGRIDDRDRRRGDIIRAVRIRDRRGRRGFRAHQAEEIARTFFQNEAGEKDMLENIAGHQLAARIGRIEKDFPLRNRVRMLDPIRFL